MIYLYKVWHNPIIYNKKGKMIGISFHETLLWFGSDITKWEGHQQWLANNGDDNISIEVQKVADELRSS